MFLEPLLRVALDEMDASDRDVVTKLDFRLLGRSMGVRRKMPITRIA